MVFSHVVSSFGIKEIFNLWKEFNSYRMFFCTQTRPLIHCFVHKYGHRDVMWKWSIHIVICSLLVGVYCVADKSKLEWKLSLTQFSPQDARNHILRLWNFKIFWGTTLPDPSEKGDKRALVDTVNWFLHSILLATSISIETPEMIFNIQNRIYPIEIVYWGICIS